MKQAIRPSMFKWRQTEPRLILCAVRWYLRYSLLFRDVEERLQWCACSMSIGTKLLFPVRSLGCFTSTMM